MIELGDAQGRDRQVGPAAGDYRYRHSGDAPIGLGKVGDKFLGDQTITREEWYRRTERDHDGAT